MSSMGLCTAATCLTTGSVAAIFAVCSGAWGLGYGVGQAMQWTMRIRDAA